MITEEAIDILQSMKSKGYDKQNEAFEMAISALFADGEMCDVLETVKAYQTDSLIQDTKSKLFEFAAQTYEWCNGCKEYDTEKHCCHRYMNFIRYSLQDSINAVLEDIKAEIELAKWCDKETRLVKNCNASGLEVALDIINKHITKLKGDTE